MNLYTIIYDWCRGVDLDLRFLKSLVLPKRESVTDPKLPSPKGKLESTYPDPTDANVFWIQPLILHLGSEVDPTEFECYLESKSK